MSTNKEVVLCVAPHPDDETLGCGGTLLRHLHDGCEVHWLIASNVPGHFDWSLERTRAREAEILAVAKGYGFTSVTRLDFPATELDAVSKSEFVQKISSCISAVKPSTLYLPYRNDAHSDHAAVFDAAAACTKVFRYPSIKSIFSYEVLSETDFGLRTDDPGFRPNYFVDTTDYIEKKLELMRIYASELGQHPFPRSEESIRAQATLRGAQAGAKAAEAFMLLKGIR